MVEGQRNNNLCISLHLHSMISEFTKDEAYSIMLDYVGGSFSARELNTTVNSAYTHTENFNTRFFEDSDTRDAVKKQLKTGVPKKEIRSQLKGQGFEGVLIDQVIKKEEENLGSSDFWVKSDRGVVSIIPFKFKRVFRNAWVLQVYSRW